jgi:hypothetical protein
MPNTRYQHELSSGIVVRLDIRDSVRFVMFETGHDEWVYATDGGTAFVCRFRGKYYALTCKHVRGTFNWQQLALTTTKFGNMIAGVDAVAHATGTGASLETDLSDMAIVELEAAMSASAFEDTAFIIDPNTCCRSRRGDKLMVCGAQKAGSEIDANTATIAPSFHLLFADDKGRHPTDPTLRSAFSLTETPIIGGVVGFSGGPVFNLTQRKLAGVMVRGGAVGREVNIHYIEIEHYLRMLDALHQDLSEVNYPVT